MPVAAVESTAQRAVLLSIALGAMLVPLNSTMIAVALPDIMDEFGVGVGAVGWLVSAYLITMAALQLLAGKLGDQLGRRRFVLGGLVYVGLASLCAALAADFGVLVFGRVQQAMASAILLTNGIALVFELLPEDRRGRGLGFVNAAVVLAAAGGPPLGGLLVGLAGWRAIFWASISITMAALLIGWRTIPDIKPQQSKSRWDWFETLSLLRSQTFACSNGAIMSSNVAIYVIFLGIPILLLDRSGWTSFQTGLMLAAMSVTATAFSPLGGRLSDRSGRRLPSVAGIALIAGSALPLAILGETVQMPVLLICLGLAGTGLGLSSVSLQTAALISAGPQQAGLASGISSTSRYLGSIIGSFILARTLDAALNDGGNFRFVFLVVALAAGMAMLMGWGIRDQGRKYPEV